MQFAGVEVARIGLGTNRLTNTPENRAFIQEAVAAGIGMIDTAHVYSRGDFKTDFTSRPVGSGPYRLVRRVPGKEILLERRPEYWGPRPNLQRVLFKVINDDSTAWDDVESPRVADGPDPYPLPPDREDGPEAMDEYGTTPGTIRQVSR